MRQTSFFLCNILRWIIPASLLFLLGSQSVRAAEAIDQKNYMRVVLMTTGYESYYHPEVVLEIEGKKVRIPYDSPALSRGSLIFHPEKESDVVKILSIERNQGHPTYRGTIILRKKEAGILIINELPIEEYLCSVVPSEMPASYEKEALKAQAVCARTYAYRQKKAGRMWEYGADVDDSVNFQVYNNLGEQEASTRAVQETAGEILCQKGEPIEAYYFSTSSGNTSTDEVWESKEEASYLKSVECLYDMEEPWSKWKVTFPLERIQSLARQKFGTQSPVTGLSIVKKSEGGAAMQLRLYTEDGEETIHKEYGIRSFLSPYGLEITQKDGTINKTLTTLPSAYFSLKPETDPKTGALIGYTLYGGGYGHGVGMSQNGANHMAAQGSTYREILDYFFNCVDLEQSPPAS